MARPESSGQECRDLTEANSLHFKKSLLKVAIYFLLNQMYNLEKVYAQRESFNVYLNSLHPSRKRKREWILL